jgi:hypothetical protein
MEYCGERFTLHLPDEFDARSEWEMPSRGYLSHSTVELESGRTYPVFFYDAVRLGQELEMSAKLDRPFIAEPGMIVLTEVTREAICRALDRLVEEGYFAHLEPLTARDVSGRNGIPQPKAKTVA